MSLENQYRTPVNLQARIALHERFSTDKVDLALWLFDQMRLLPQAVILEVGCGTGRLWHKNATRLDRTWNVTLSDFSAGMVAQAQAMLAPLAFAATFAVTDAQALPFPDSYFDVVIANHMLYHVPDLPQALHDIKRVLKPGGWLYASTNSKTHMQELDDLTPDYFPHVPIGTVIQQFTLESGVAAMHAYFTEITVQARSGVLLVTEAEPLVAYNLSRMSVHSQNTTISPAQRAEFTTSIEQELQRRGGVIRITTESGLIRGQKS